MLIHYNVGRRTQVRRVWAQRRVGGVTYTGTPVIADSKEKLRLAVVVAVEELQRKHGRQLPLKLGQVKSGGEN